ASEVANVPGRATIDQDKWGLGARYGFDMLGGSTEFSMDHARFTDRSVESEEEIVFIDDVWAGDEGESMDIDSTDRESSLRVARKGPLGATIREAGVDYRTKKRDVSHTDFECELDNPGDAVLYEADGVINSLIEEDRLEPFLMLAGQAGRIDWETGLR